MDVLKLRKEAGEAGDLLQVEICDMAWELSDLPAEHGQHRALFVARYGLAAVKRSFNLAVELLESAEADQDLAGYNLY